MFHKNLSIIHLRCQIFHKVHKKRFTCERNVICWEVCWQKSSDFIFILTQITQVTGRNVFAKLNMPGIVTVMHLAELNCTAEIALFRQIAGKVDQWNVDRVGAEPVQKWPTADLKEQSHDLSINPINYTTIGIQKLLGFFSLIIYKMSPASQQEHCGFMAMDAWTK